MNWAEAQGCRVVDSDGRSYIDLSGGFGVAALGHRSPEIEAAVRAQADRCVHALGDLAEADVTAELRERLGGEGREVMLGVTGEDAVSSLSRAPTTGPVCSRSQPRGSSSSGARSRPGCPGRCTAAHTERIPARSPPTPRAS